MDHSDHGLLQPHGHSAISERMRRLLDLAAQDHVYEQRTRSAALEEVRQRLEGMEWLLREVRERELGGLGAAVEATVARLDDIAARPPGWAEGLAQHADLIRAHLDARMTEVASRIDRLTDGVTSRIDRLTLDAATGAEHLTGMIQALDERLDRVEDRTGTAASGITGVDARLDSIDRRLMAYDDRFDSLEGRIDSRFTTLDERITGYDHRVGEIDGRLAALEETMLALAEAILRSSRPKN